MEVSTFWSCCWMFNQRFMCSIFFVLLSLTWNITRWVFSQKKNDLKQKNYWPNEPWWYDHIQQCRSWHRRKKIAERYCCWRNRLDECRTNRICFPLDIRIDHVIIWITFLIEFNMRMQLNYLNVYSLFLLNLCVKWYNYISVTA